MTGRGAAFRLSGGRSGLVRAAYVLGAFIGAGVPVAMAEGGAAQLSLTTQNFMTDEGGAFISVAVKNGAAQEQNQVIVSCVFRVGQTPVGSAATPLYAIPAGETGYGQVRLIGATSATSASCSITSAQ